MKTLFVLMAQYDGQVVIPLDRVCKDYFTHLTTEMFQRKVGGRTNQNPYHAHGTEPEKRKRNSHRGPFRILGCPARCRRKRKQSVEQRATQ